MITVIFRKSSTIEKEVQYTDAEVRTYGRDKIVEISDTTLALTDEFDSYRIVEDIDGIAEHTGEARG